MTHLSRVSMTFIAVLAVTSAAAQSTARTNFRLGQAPAQAAPGTAPTAANNTSLSQLRTSYAPGMTLGAGYDPRTLSIKAQCITFQPKPQAAPNESSNDVSVVTSEEDIQSDIQASYAESMGLGAFAESTNANFANSVDYESSAVTVIAHARVTSPTMNTVDPNSVQLNVRGTDYGAMMASNYSQFRSICGDYYVSAILTGGDYAGALSIKKNLFKTSTTAALTLAQSASALLTSESTTGSLQAALTSLQSQGVVEVSEMWKGGPSGDQIKPASTVPELFSNYANSFSSLGSTTSPVRVLLSPYGWLTSDAVPDQSADYAALESLAQAYVNYSSVQKDIAYLAAHPGEYANPPASSIVQGWLTSINNDMASVKAQIAACADPTKPCPAAIPVTKTADAYESEIPTYLGLPQLCLHISVNDPTAPSGLYTLYLNGDPNKPMPLYCKLGNDPQAYLPLYYTGASDPGVAWNQWPSPPGRQYNYSQQYYTHMLATIYTKVAINESTLRVDVNDTTFSTTYGPPEGGNSFVAYGTAAECLEWQQIGHSNIDLRGTAFAIDTSKTSWGATGYEINMNGCCPGTAQYDDTTGAKVQQVDIAANSGRCGAMMPWTDAEKNHNLYLKWVGTSF
ncbi:MAG TPA: GON domain-containing protein [Thermoanaerobaculia bacterium]|nr:GON domain-containing protein [Thermoanaerobaculia bacterium]